MLLTSLYCISVALTACNVNFTVITTTGNIILLLLLVVVFLEIISVINIIIIATIINNIVIAITVIAFNEERILVLPSFAGSSLMSAFRLVDYQKSLGFVS